MEREPAVGVHNVTVAASARRPSRWPAHAAKRPQACDATPRPSALTLTLRRLPLRFILEVPSCQGLSILQQFDFPLQTRHLFLSQARVALLA